MNIHLQFERSYKVKIIGYLNVVFSLMIMLMISSDITALALKDNPGLIIIRYLPTNSRKL